MGVEFWTKFMGFLIILSIIAYALKGFIQKILNKK